MDVPAGAGIHDLCDLHADPFEVGDGCVAFGVRGEDYGPRSRLHAVHVDESAGRAGQHDAGAVVSVEHVGSFDEAGGHDEGLRPGLDEPFDGNRMVALEDAEPVVFVAAGDR